MPNFMTDEELGLSNGDLWRCKHCGTVRSVDDPICGCPESLEASRKADREWHRNYFGHGKLKTRQFVVTIVAPDTEPAFSEAWNSMAAWGPEVTEDSDDILGYAWEIKEVT